MAPKRGRTAPTAAGAADGKGRGGKSKSPNAKAAAVRPAAAAAAAAMTDDSAPAPAAGATATSAAPSGVGGGVVDCVNAGTQALGLYGTWFDEMRIDVLAADPLLPLSVWCDEQPVWPLTRAQWDYWHSLADSDDVIADSDVARRTRAAVAVNNIACVYVRGETAHIRVPVDVARADRLFMIAFKMNELCPIAAVNLSTLRIAVSTPPGDKPEFAALGTLDVVLKWARDAVVKHFPQQCARVTYKVPPRVTFENRSAVLLDESKDGGAAYRALAPDARAALFAFASAIYHWRIYGMETSEEESGAVDADTRFVDALRALPFEEAAWIYTHFPPGMLLYAGWGDDARARAMPDPATVEPVGTPEWHAKSRAEAAPATFEFAKASAKKAAGKSKSSAKGKANAKGKGKAKGKRKGKAAAAAAAAAMSDDDDADADANADADDSGADANDNPAVAAADAAAAAAAAADDDDDDDDDVDDGDIAGAAAAEAAKEAEFDYAGRLRDLVLMRAAAERGFAPAMWDLAHTLRPAPPKAKDYYPPVDRDLPAWQHPTYKVADPTKLDPAHKKEAVVWMERFARLAPCEQWWGADTLLRWYAEDGDRDGPLRLRKAGVTVYTSDALTLAAAERGELESAEVEPPTGAHLTLRKRLTMLGASRNERVCEALLVHAEQFYGALRTHDPARVPALTTVDCKALNLDALIEDMPDSAATADELKEFDAKVAHEMVLGTSTLFAKCRPADYIESQERHTGMPLSEADRANAWRTPPVRSVNVDFRGARTLLHGDEADEHACAQIGNLFGDVLKPPGAGAGASPADGDGAGDGEADATKLSTGPPGSGSGFKPVHQTLETLKITVRAFDPTQQVAAATAAARFAAGHLHGFGGGGGGGGDDEAEAAAAVQLAVAGMADAELRANDDNATRGDGDDDGDEDDAPSRRRRGRSSKSKGKTVRRTAKGKGKGKGKRAAAAAAAADDSDNDGESNANDDGGSGGGGSGTDDFMAMVERMEERFTHVAQEQANRATNATSADADGDDDDDDDNSAEPTRSRSRGKTKGKRKAKGKRAAAAPAAAADDDEDSGGAAEPAARVPTAVTNAIAELMAQVRHQYQASEGGVDGDEAAGGAGDDGGDARRADMTDEQKASIQRVAQMFVREMQNQKKLRRRARTGAGLAAIRKAPDADAAAGGASAAADDSDAEDADGNPREPDKRPAVARKLVADILLPILKAPEQYALLSHVGLDTFLPLHAFRMLQLPALQTLWLDARLSRSDTAVLMRLLPRQLTSLCLSDPDSRLTPQLVGELIARRNANDLDLRMLDVGLLRDTQVAEALAVLVCGDTRAEHVRTNWALHVRPGSPKMWEALQYGARHPEVAGTKLRPAPDKDEEAAAAAAAAEDGSEPEAKTKSKAKKGRTRGKGRGGAATAGARGKRKSKNASTSAADADGKSDGSDDDDDAEEAAKIAQRQADAAHAARRPPSSLHELAVYCDVPRRYSDDIDPNAAVVQDMGKALYGMPHAFGQLRVVTLVNVPPNVVSFAWNNVLMSILTVQHEKVFSAEEKAKGAGQPPDTDRRPGFGAGATLCEIGHMETGDDAQDIVEAWGQHACVRRGDNEFGHGTRRWANNRRLCGVPDPQHGLSLWLQRNRALRVSWARIALGISFARAVHKTNPVLVLSVLPLWEHVHTWLTGEDEHDSDWHALLWRTNLTPLEKFVRTKFFAAHLKTPTPAPARAATAPARAFGAAAAAAAAMATDDAPAPAAAAAAVGSGAKSKKRKAPK